MPANSDDTEMVALVTHIVNDVAVGRYAAVHGLPRDEVRADEDLTEHLMQLIVLFHQRIDRGQ